MMRDLSRAPDPSASEIKSRETPQASLEWADDSTLNVRVSGDFDGIEAACRNRAVMTGLIEQTAALGSPGKEIDQTATNFALGYLDAMQPEDPAEALLLTQMAATHQLMMTLSRRLNHCETIQQQDSAERALTKAARTFTVQMDTLKRYRAKVQQVVRVERVTVEDGGQAIVGHVQTGGGGHEEK